MADQSSSPRHLVLFDGACGFCQRAVLSVARRDSAGAFRFASLDSELARGLLAEREIVPGGAGSMVVLPDWERSRLPALDRSQGALFIARRLAWPWKGLAAFRVLPRWLLDHCYDAIARNRHRLAGGTESCAVPEAALRDRFLA